MLPLSSFAGIILLAVATATASADEPPLERQFDDVVRPFLNDYCLGCHGQAKQEAKLDLSRDTSAAAVVKNVRAWELVLDRLDAEEMPPEKAKRHPAPHQRRAVIDWIAAIRDREARKNAGDPGPVLARRLSNAEFDYTIRDLTGVDIRPTREFPVDPANEAGFDNSGESLAMSPALVKKYLAAARSVADHLVLKPRGFVFAPHPAVTETDRDRYCVRRILDFYERNRVDHADYFLAAWRYRLREGGERPDATLHEIASEAGLSPRYLETVWNTLCEPWPERGPLGQLQALWRALPEDGRDEAPARNGCRQMRELVVRLRKEYEPKVEGIKVRGISPGSQPFVLWKDRRLAEGRMRHGGKSGPRDLDEFCRVFPDAFAISDRQPYFESKPGKSGRPLTAGFHLMQGYFRDDAPLCTLVLDEAGRRELDSLWRDLNFVTSAPLRQYRDFIFFERAEPPRFAGGPEFDFARSEDRDATSPAKIAQLRDAYLARARQVKANDQALEAIAVFFAEIAEQIGRVEDDQRAAEPTHLDALLEFAGRAYRRPLSGPERDGLLAFYRRLREDEALGHEDAVRDTLAGILMSPHFLYRSEPAEPGAEVRPLSDHALASRLSYFLWSSMPDRALFDRSEAGDLHRPEVLVAQARRMLREPHARALAVEFTGNWLDFRRFEEHNSVDRERFPSFTNELRRAMYEEPVRFFVDLLKRDGSILELLDADHTFVNPILARHYGMPVPANTAHPDGWARVDDARVYGRGGFLPMAVFLTRNSPGLRTSPVKRGYWVVRRVLGEEIPPPPPTVPELPRDEAATGELSLPELLARHRQDRSCLGCHQRFDSVGLAFEGYGPIGERRARDLGGRPVIARATFPDGTEREAVDGLRRYIDEKRRDEFVENLCRKLFAYALGRTLRLSDEPAIAAVREQLASSGYRFHTLVEAIVTSPQFLNKRGRDDPRD